jgi:hypothetical protein
MIPSYQFSPLQILGLLEQANHAIGFENKETEKITQSKLLRSGLGFPQVVWSRLLLSYFSSFGLSVNKG